MISILFIINYFIDWLVSVPDWIETHSDLVTAAATAAIALFTLILYCATRKLWKVSQEQSRHMETSIAVADKAADAAQKSADAAEKSVYAARETAKTMRAQDRAYIFVNVEFDKFQKTSAEINKIMFDGLEGDYKAIVKIINHGKTPAIIKSFHYKIEFFHSGQEVGDYFGNIWMTKSKIEPGSYIIECGKDEPFLIPFSIDSFEKQYFNDPPVEKTKLLCLGCIEYEDVFDTPHKTWFCWEFRYSIANFYICIEYRYNERT